MPVKVVFEATLEVVYQCNTIKEAEAFIAGVALKDREEVESGAYGIDAHEELLS